MNNHSQTEVSLGLPHKLMGALGLDNLGWLIHALTSEPLTRPIFDIMASEPYYELDMTRIERNWCCLHHKRHLKREETSYYKLSSALEP